MTFLTRFLNISEQSYCWQYCHLFAATLKTSYCYFRP